MSVLTIIEEIRAARGNAKIGVISSHVDDAEFQVVLKATYNTALTYYLKTIPKVATHTKLVTLTHAVWAIIDELATRIVSGADAKARVATLAGSMSIEDAQVLALVLKGDLKIGAQAKTINKAFGYELIPVFPYQRCELAQGKHLDNMVYPAWSQLKSDGMFVNVIYNTKKGKLKTISRDGKPIRLPKYARSAAKALLRGMKANKSVAHGELLVVRAGKVLPREIGNGILNSYNQGGSLANGDTVRLVLWDCVPHKNWKAGFCDIRYAERYLELLWCATDINADVLRIIKNEVVVNKAEAVAHYKKMRSLGMEGTVLKNIAATWKDHTSPHQLKMKNEMEFDMVVVGFNPGDPDGKHANTFGSIQVESSDGKVACGVSGFSDAKRKEIYENQDDVLGDIMEVTVEGLMQPNARGVRSCFLPRFSRWRPEKKEADTLDRMLAIEAATISD